LKLIATPRAGEVVTAISETGLLGSLFAGAADPARLRRLIAIEAAREAPPDALLRLAALAVGIEEDAERLRERLRLSNAEYTRLAGLAATLEAWHGATAPPSLGDLSAMLFDHGRQGARDAVSLIHVDSAAAARDARFASAFNFVSDTPIPRPPFNGADVLARGVGSGERVGAVLKTWQALWIRAGFPREPEILARLLDEALNR
jgi:poly(A) polymerase